MQRLHLRPVHIPFCQHYGLDLAENFGIFFLIENPNLTGLMSMHDNEYRDIDYELLSSRFLLKENEVPFLEVDHSKIRHHDIYQYLIGQLPFHILRKNYVGKFSKLCQDME